MSGLIYTGNTGLSGMSGIAGIAVASGDPRTLSPTTSVYYTDPGITIDTGVDLWPNPGTGSGFTQAVTTRQPTLGAGVIGDGSDDALTSTSVRTDAFDNDAGTLICAVNFASATRGAIFFANGFRLRREANGTGRVLMSLTDSGGAKLAVVNGVDDEDHIVSVKFDGVDVQLRVDGGSWAITAAGPISATDLAQHLFAENNLGANSFDGAIYDLSTWNTVFSDDSISDVEAWLDDTYSLGVL